MLAVCCSITVPSRAKEGKRKKREKWNEKKQKLYVPSTRFFVEKEKGGKRKKREKKKFMISSIHNKTNNLFRNMSGDILPFGQLLRYLVQGGGNESCLDSEFKTVLETMRTLPNYDGDDVVEVVLLGYVYRNLRNTERKKCFLVAFLERWLEIDCMTTTIMGNMTKDNGGKGNVILPYLLEGIKTNERLTFQNIDQLVPDEVGCWVEEIHERNEAWELELIGTVCHDKDLIKCIPWLTTFISVNLLFKDAKFPCGRGGTWLSIALSHYSNDDEENVKLMKSAKDVCVFLILKGWFNDCDNDYCMADVLFYITDSLQVPQLNERERVLTVECNKLLPDGLE